MPLFPFSTWGNPLAFKASSSLTVSYSPLEGTGCSTLSSPQPVGLPESLLRSVAISDRLYPHEEGQKSILGVFRPDKSKGMRGRETDRQRGRERTLKTLGSSSSFLHRSWLSPMGLQGVGGQPWIESHRASSASLLPDQGLN